MPLTQVAGPRRHAARAEDLAAARRRPGQHQRRPAARRCASRPIRTALAAYGLNIDDLRTTIANANVNTPKGNFDGPARAYTINANDQLDRRRRLSTTSSSPTATARRSGCPTSPTSSRAPENTKLGAWMNTTPAVILNVQRQPGANVIEVVDRIKALLPQLQATLPAAVDVARADRPHDHHPRLGARRASSSSRFAVVLVVLVIFLFLRSAARRPSSRACRCRCRWSARSAVMYLAGLQPQQPVADGADHRHRLRGRRRDRDDREHRALHRGGRSAAARPRCKGSEQIGFTIISLTVSLIAVLIPLLFMGDVVGRLFREFAITLAVTILISAVVSLTLVPMMCAKLLRHRRRGARCRRCRARSRANGSTRLIARYGRLLDWVLDHQPLTLLVAVAHPGADGRALHRDPEGLLPGAGHRPDPGHLRGAAVGLLRGDGRAPAGAGRRRS